MGVCRDDYLVLGESRKGIHEVMGFGLWLTANGQIYVTLRDERREAVAKAAEKRMLEEERSKAF